MKSSVFHIGFPKSGSTFLQRQVFPLLNDDYSYMGVHAAEGNKSLHSLLDRFHINLLKTDGLNFDMAQCIKDRDEILNIYPDKPALFSYEYAVSVLYANPDAVTKAERLFKVFNGKLKIIIIIREQSKILSSQYRDHPFEPYNIQRGKPVSFEKWYRQTDQLRFFRFTELVHYEKLIQVYDDLFGHKNVLVLPMELMTYDSKLYVQKMSDFLEVDPDLISQNLHKPPINTGHSARTNNLRRLRRKIPIPLEFSKILPLLIYKAIKRIIEEGKQEKVTMSDHLKEEIKNRYASSNKHLENRIGVPLEPLGYAIQADNNDELMTVESSYGKYTGYKNDRAILQTQKFGAHTRPELSMILSFIKKGDVVLDVGAHIGTFAIPIKKGIGPKGKLFSFEANPKTFEFLEKNLKDNGLDATTFNNGVSNKSGSLFIKNRGDSSRNSISDYLVESSESEANFIEVQLIKIDDVISEPVDFIKIDVEGMEIDVLKSAEKTIEKYHPVIYSEYVEGYLKRAGANPKEFEAFFKKHNYDFFMNAGERNATNDDFKLVKVLGPQYIRGQVDFLMFHKESDRYPTEFLNWRRHAPGKFLWNRFRNFLKDINAKWKLKK